MMHVRRVACFFLLLLLAAPALGQDGSEPIVATDLLNIRQLSGVSVSPDGRSVLYSVQTIHEKADEEGEYEYRSHLWLYPADRDAAPRPLTQGRHGASQPDWHPDGDRIAFVRTVDDTPQVFVLPLIGGEPYQLTDFEHGAGSPKWSPDGSQLMIAASLSHETLLEEFPEGPGWPGERPEWPGVGDATDADPDGSIEEVRAWLEQNRLDENPRIIHRLDFQGEHDLQPERSYRHLFVYDVPEDPARTGPLTDDPIRLTNGFFSYGGGEWLPHGRQIVMSSAQVTDEHPDRVRESALYIVDSDGTRMRTLLQMGDYALLNPSVSPDGQALTFSATPLDDPSYGQTEIGLYRLDGTVEPELLTRDFDRSASSASWSPDGWHVYFTAASDGGFPLYRIAPFERADVDAPEAPAETNGVDVDDADIDDEDLFADLTEDELEEAEEPEGEEETAENETDEPDAPTVEQLSDYTTGIRSFDVSSGSIYYVLTRHTNPYELYANNIRFDTERRISEHNATWIADRRLSEPEPFTITRDDTLEVDAWIMRPAFYEEGQQYPLLLQIHGGPMAMWGPGEASMWHEFQYFTSRGYGVVYSNPRGSGGYGRDFQAANFRDWGHGPAGDVLAAADVAANEPWADPDRQVMTGGSYAGYLTAWIVSQDHRFQAAAAQRGVYDLTTFLGEGNAWRLVPYHFGGYPWEGPRPGVEDTLHTSELVTDIRVLMDEQEEREEPDMPEDPEETPEETDELDELDEPEEMDQPDEAEEHALSPRDHLIANSPLTYVDQIQTPLLILHADQDLRTGVIQSEMLYRSLKILERPVEYVRYPGAGHDLSRTGDPNQRIDRILRMYEFFERYIDHDTPLVTETPADEPDEPTAAEEPLPEANW